MDHRRRLPLAMTAVALVAAALQALTGSTDLVLELTPFFLIATLLLAGHHVGEERILRRLLAARPLRTQRRVVARWPRRRIEPLASLLARSPRSLRGPPAVAPSRA